MNLAPDATQQNTTIRVRAVSLFDFESLLPALVALLTETVRAGSSLGFLPSLTHDEARGYWLSLCAEINDGSRLLVAAYSEGRIVGAGQLMLSSWPNARHRAELQKLFVAPALRGRGVGQALMAALHDAARARGRSLLILNTRRGGRPERLYKALGYREAGVVPGFTRGAGGESYDHVTLYQEFPLRPSAERLDPVPLIDTI